MVYFSLLKCNVSCYAAVAAANLILFDPSTQTSEKTSTGKTFQNINSTNCSLTSSLLITNSSWSLKVVPRGGTGRTRVFPVKMWFGAVLSAACGVRVVGDWTNHAWARGTIQARRSCIIFQFASFGARTFRRFAFLKTCTKLGANAQKWGLVRVGWVIALYCSATFANEVFIWTSNM